MEHRVQQDGIAKDPSLVVHQTAPFNAGPSLPDLAQAFVTPTERFFARNHGDIPEIDLAIYRFEIAGLVERSELWSIDGLRRAFPFVRRTITLQCAGNRRQELNAVAPIPGELPWGSNALSTGVWGGFLLADLLAAAGVDPAAGHVAFLGCDQTERQGKQVNFGGSIPLATARACEVLLACELNGEPLPAAHGGPLRVVVPGVIGARSVKWLQRISLLAEPSDNYFQAHAYRMVTPEHVAQGTQDEAPMINELAINSVICDPIEGSVLAPGPAKVRGYALAGGVASVARVEFSADGGRTWAAATLLQQPQPGVWCLWEAAVDLAPGEHEWVVRAVDSQGRAQPATPLWNIKGYLNNAWQRIKIEVRPA